MGKKIKKSAFYSMNCYAIKTALLLEVLIAIKIMFRVFRLVDKKRMTFSIQYIDIASISKINYYVNHFPHTDCLIVVFKMWPVPNNL